MHLCCEGGVFTKMVASESGVQVVMAFSTVRARQLSDETWTISVSVLSVVLKQCWSVELPAGVQVWIVEYPHLVPDTEATRAIVTPGSS